MRRVYQSNRVEWLAGQLGESLFAERDPFSLPWVVVPNQAVKEFLNGYFAERFGVAMGIRFLFLDEAIGELAGVKRPFPSRCDLALKLTHVLETGECGPLSEYVERGEGRAISLALALADPLMHWGVYGGQDKALLEAVYSEWETPQQVLEGKKPVVHPPALHLFGFYHLPKLYFDYLCRGSFSFYLFSPCAHFWTDTLSEKQAERLDIPQEVNPLLADWGRLQRRLFKMIEEADAEVVEHYPIACGVEERPEYEDDLGGELIFEEKELTLLTSLQADLLCMRPRSLGLNDDSLKLYSTLSPLREVELCASEILRTQSLPSDLVVMAPDITPYVPYIEAVFEREGIPYQILDIQTPDPDSLEAGLLQLLSLIESRWEASRLLKLFRHPLFPISEEELALIEGWMAEGGIRWGKGPEHWKEVLGKQYDLRGEASWEAGLNRLFEALTCLKEEGGLSVEISQAETLGKLAQLFGRLEELTEVIRTSALKLEEWAALWTAVSVEFFGKGPKFPWGPSPHTYPFSHIRPQLEREWKSTRSSVHPHSLEGTLFCSFLPMRIRPASHLFLMGMDEGSFPRKGAPTPSDFAKTEQPIPTPGELDRALLLETLHAASRRLTISYCRVSSDDGLPQNPSPLVTDLLSYLGKEEQMSHHPLYSQKRRGRGAVEKKGWIPLPLPTGEIVIDTRDLRLSASDPLRLHCRELGINLDRRPSHVEDDEPFDLDSLDETLASWSAAGHPTRVSPNIPAGPFGRLFAERIEKRGEELKKGVQEITGEDLHTLKVEGLEIEMSEATKVKIVGDIGPVTSEGLLVFAKGAKGGACVRALPLFLLFAHLIQVQKLPYTPALHFVREGKSFQAPDDPLPLLKRYLDYHLRCLTEPSPLNADLIADLIQGKERASLAEDVSWVWRDGESLSQAVSHWQREADAAFGIIGEEWWS